MKSHSMTVGALALGTFLAVTKPSAAEVNRTQFRGESVSASFFGSNEIICADGSVGFEDTSVFVSAFANVTRSTFGNTSGETAFVFVSQFDSCTGQFSSAFALNLDPDYTQFRTSSASVATTFDLVDDSTGVPLGTLIVDLDFTGVGDVVRTNSHSVTQSGDFLLQSRSQGTFRSATVSGTLSLDGEELVGGLQFADLSDTRSGDLTVTR